MAMSFALVACASTNTDFDANSKPQAKISSDEENVQGLAATKIAKNMDADDRQQLANLVKRATIHATKTWKNDTSGYTYTFNSLNIFVNRQGMPCRDYTFKASDVWHKESMQATACRDESGEWNIING